MPSLDWDNYLKAPNVSAAEHKAISAASFAGQRETIGKLCRTLRPRSVLCMGAGFLNDIPLDSLIAENADIYLVDWVAGITEPSFRRDLISERDGRCTCLIAKCTADRKKYCAGYAARDATPPSHLPASADTCGNFVRVDDAGGPSCASYEPAAFPRHLKADVTGGVADLFARQVPAIMRHAAKPQRALREAIQASARPRADAPLPLADHSIDFITSSMVVSQFDFEPYGYFVRNLYRHFGQDALARGGDALDTLAATLRTNLFLQQTDAHCREIARLLKPGGRAYFSIEVLHREQPLDHWFYVDAAGKALEIVARHFMFDLDTLPDIVNPERTDMVHSGTSIVQAYLLVRPSS